MRRDEYHRFKVRSSKKNKVYAPVDGTNYPKEILTQT